MPPRSAKSRSRRAHPADALGIEAVGGLVEDQHLGVAEQRVREPEPLAHAERVLAHALAGGGLVQPDERQQLVDAPSGRRPSSARSPRAPRGRGGRGAGRWRRAGRRRGGPGSRGRGSRPPSTAEPPASGADSPTSIRIVVVLPAPFGPRNPVTVPGSQRNETSLTTVRPPRRFVRPVASIMAASIGIGGGAPKRPRVDTGIDFGRGSRRRPSGVRWRPWPRAGRCSRAACWRSRAAGARRATGSSTRRCCCSRWPSARSRSAAPRTRHPTTMVFVDLVIGLAALVPLWWRRRYPFAVALLTIIPGAISAFAAGAGLIGAVQRRAARLPPRDRDLHRPRDPGGHRLRVRLPRPGDRRRVRHLARGAVPGRRSCRGACSRARSATCCAARTSARGSSRPSSARGSSRRARPSGAGSRARCTTCSRTGSRCFRVHAGALEFHPDAPPEEIAEAAGVIRATAHDALQRPARGDRRAARRATAAPSRRSRRSTRSRR